MPSAKLSQKFRVMIAPMKNAEATTTATAIVEHERALRDMRHFSA
jgi:hypothetical protein